MSERKIGIFIHGCKLEVLKVFALCEICLLLCLRENWVVILMLSFTSFIRCCVLEDFALCVQCVLVFLCLKEYWVVILMLFLFVSCMW